MNDFTDFVSRDKLNLVELRKLVSQSDFNVTSMLATTNSLVAKTDKLIRDSDKLALNCYTANDNMLVSKSHKLIHESRQRLNGAR